MDSKVKAASVVVSVAVFDGGASGVATRLTDPSCPKKAASRIRTVVVNRDFTVADRAGQGAGLPRSAGRLSSVARKRGCAFHGAVVGLGVGPWGCVLGGRLEPPTHTVVFTVGTTAGQVCGLEVDLNGAISDAGPRLG